MDKRETQSVPTIAGPCFRCESDDWPCDCDCHYIDGFNTVEVPLIEQEPPARRNVPPLLLMVAALLCLCGCATPQKLIAMNRRAIELGRIGEARCKDAKSCAAVAPCTDAAARAATEAEKALRKQADAVRVTDGARADAAEIALRSAERECAK